MPVSNFSGKSLVPVGVAAGITRGGTIDMAGNVKEWCLTAAGTGRYIAGGAWDEPAYTFNSTDAQSQKRRLPDCEAHFVEHGAIRIPQLDSPPVNGLSADGGPAVGAVTGAGIGLDAELHGPA